MRARCFTSLPALGAMVGVLVAGCGGPIVDAPDAPVDGQHEASSTDGRTDTDVANGDAGLDADARELDGFATDAAATDAPPAVDHAAIADARPSDASTHVCGTVHYLAPGDDVLATFEALCAGDTLRVQPGTYASVAPAVRPGTASAPITITAADPTRPPLFVGWFDIHRPTWWTFDHLRFQASVHTREALTIAGGNDWTVTGCEAFGASATGAFANVAISADIQPTGTTEPQNWRFVNSCVHDAGHGTLLGHTSSTDHNIYVNTVGPAPGLISRNILYNATAGENVKVGNGGCATCPATSGIAITYNTMYNAARQILLFGGVSHMTVMGNLLIRSTGATGDVGTYLGSLSVHDAAAVNHNYGYMMRWNLWAPGPTTAANYTSIDNPIGADPVIVAGCTGFHPGNAAAARYGRWTTTVW